MCKREVQEEVGLQVKNIKYLASQSWAISNRIYDGFFSAEAFNDRFEIDNNEITGSKLVFKRTIYLNYQNHLYQTL